jgi:hypothetical protein
VALALNRLAFYDLRHELFELAALAGNEEQQCVAGRVQYSGVELLLNICVRVCVCVCVCVCVSGNEEQQRVARCVQYCGVELL